MAKVQLYTCSSGIILFEGRCTFGAWDKESASYMKEDVKILVDEKHIKSGKIKGEYDVINIESVEIIR